MMLFDERDVRVHAIERVIAMTWHDRPRHGVVKRLDQAIAGYHREHADGAALIVVPFPGAPDEITRNALQEMTKRIGRSVVGASVLLSLDGLRGRVLRGVVNGVISAFSLPFPVSVVESQNFAALHALEFLRKKGLATPAVADVVALLDLTGDPCA